MVGITACGVYVPLWRLPRELIDKNSRGERAVANFDEDSITMAVAAAIDCINGLDRGKIDGLFFASTTSPYKEKQAATAVASAIDLRRDIVTADFANSLRAGTDALRAAVDAVKAGSAGQVLVAAADCRIGAPGSPFEQSCGDGAAALLIADSDVAVEIKAGYSICNELLDVWRMDGDSYIRSWEERFVVTEGYLKIVYEAASGLMKRCNLEANDFAKAIFYAPGPRRLRELATSLGFDPRTQVQDPLADSMGNTGTPYPLMLLAACLEQAKPGERILMASYGDGSDAFILEVRDQVESVRCGRGMQQLLSSKKVLSDYQTYLRWRGLLDIDISRYTPMGDLSASALARERKRIYSLHGSKCRVCGTIEYPPPRVCGKCHSRGQFEEVRLSDKRGKVFTYTLDYQLSPLDVPLVIAVVDFEGGGRMSTWMTDRDVKEVRIDMPVEMTFRKLYSAEGIHNYFWKSMPPRC
jgi:3-hydroxy-3-methylglutaryl CoA synthase